MPTSARILTGTVLLAVAIGWPAALEAACRPDETTLCLLDGRLAVQVEWSADGGRGAGGAVPFSDESGFFWFFDRSNLELSVKALDATSINGNLWFFYGALSDVEYTITVTDTITTEVRTYRNRQGTQCGDGDTAAFASGTAAPVATGRGERLAAGAPHRGETVAIGACDADAQTACLGDGRFAVRAQWRDTLGTGRVGEAGVLPIQGDSAPFWFFSPGNVELVIKVLDARSLNDRFWVFFGALSDVEYWVEVRDTVTGAVRTYHNAPGEVCGLGDVEAFCDDPAGCGRVVGPAWAATPVTGDALSPDGDLLPFELRRFDLAQDVDAISLHQDFYGIPWEAFAAGGPPPPAWSGRMQEIATWAHGSGRPLYLSLSVVGGEDRAELESRSIEPNGRLGSEDGWSARCYNFDTAPDGAKWELALRRYVRYMAELFRPEWLTVGIELNLFRAACDAVDPAAWDALVRVVNSAYDAAKAVDPRMAVFPTFQIEALAGILGPGDCVGEDPVPCIDAGLARARLLKRDRFAISSYPHVARLLGAEESFPDLVDAVLERVRPERAIIAETGAPSLSPRINFGSDQSPACTELGPYDDSSQRRHLDDVAAAAERWGMDLVTWWSARDVIPADTATSCPCQDSEGVCALVSLFREILGVDGDVAIKLFAGMGFREWDGSEKALLGRWRELRDR